MSVMVTVGAPPGTVGYEAQRLDRLFPGWHERVDTEELHLWSMQRCVLGQSQGSFTGVWHIVFHDALIQGDENPIMLYCETEYENDWIAEIERRR